MSSIPLPALAVQPPQQQDSLGNISKLMALRSMMGQQQMQQQQIQSQQQELQIRAQQVKDQQATTAAMKAVNPADPKYKNDSDSYYTDLSQAVLDNGGSANAATAMQQHGLTIKKTVSDIAKQDSETGSKNLETFIAKHKAIGDAIQGLVDSVPDEQLHAAAQAKFQELAQSGVMDPPSAQRALQGLQNTTDPTVLRQQLHGLANVTMGAKAVADQQKTLADTGKANADAAKSQQETQFYQQNPAAGAPGVPAETVSLMDYMRKPAAPGEPMHTPSNYPAWKAQQEAIATAPQKEAVAAAEGAARANTEIGKSRQETSDKQYQTAIGADDRLNRMEKSYTDATQNHNQQAMLALLTDHIGMTLGLQKGARITKDIINEAAQSQPWLAGMAAKFDSDGYLSGVNLSPGQMKQMLDLGYSARENAWDSANKTSQLYGVAPPPNAAKVYNQRDPNVKVYDKPAPGSSGKSVSLAAARKLPAMQGKSDDEIKAAIQAQGHTVAP